MTTTNEMATQGQIDGAVVSRLTVTAVSVTHVTLQVVDDDGGQRRDPVAVTWRQLRDAASERNAVDLRAVYASALDAARLMARSRGLCQREWEGYSPSRCDVYSWMGEITPRDVPEDATKGATWRHLDPDQVQEIAESRDAALRLSAEIDGYRDGTVQP